MTDGDLADVLGDDPQSVRPDWPSGQRRPVLVIAGDEPQVQPERRQLRVDLAQVSLAAVSLRPEAEVADLEDQVGRERLCAVDHLERGQCVHVQVAYQQDALWIGHGRLLGHQ